MTEITRLQIGDPAPKFTLPAHDGSSVSLSDYEGRPVILYFYPAAMTPGCTKQACDFRDSLASLHAHGYQVVGISRDEVSKLAKFAQRDSLTFPLLSDPDLAVHKAFGAFGIKKLYGKEIEGVLRSTFVVDEHGRISYAAYNVRATGHVAKLRRDLGLD